MPKTQTAIGIDIGTHSLKAVMLRRRGTHTAMARAATIELGDLAFVEDSERKDRRLAELLRALLRRARIPRRKASAGLAGRDYFVKYLRVPPTTPDKLRKLITYEAAEDPAAGSKDQTHDFLLLDLPSRTEELTVLVVITRDDTLRRHLELLRRAGAGTDSLTIDAVALFNAYVAAKDEAIYNDKTTLLVDIGAQHTDVVVQRNAKMLFVRNLTLGGNRFTEAVQDEFKLPMREAEELKIAQGAILPSHFDVAAEIDTSSPEGRLSAALLEPAENIYNTLQATIKYCQTQTRMPNLRIDEVVLTGRCAHLRGLREFLAHRFRVPVEVFDPLANLDLSPLSPEARDDVASCVGGYTTAIGLALREFDERPVRPITLVPEAMRRRREFFAHDFFIYAAAAVFALAFAAMAWCSSLAAAREEQNLAARRRVVTEAEGLLKQLALHQAQNAALASLTSGLKHVLDTGRRTCELLAILKQAIPPQLTIESATVGSERTAPAGARFAGADAPGSFLLLEGRVADKIGDQHLSIAGAQQIVDNFLATLRDQSYLFGAGKVTKYPDPRDPEGRRSFRMIIYLAAPFQGG